MLFYYIYKMTWAYDFFFKTYHLNGGGGGGGANTKVPDMYEVGGGVFSGPKTQK